MTNLKEEFQKFLEDIDNNIKNPKDLEYVKSRVADLFMCVLSEMERIMDFKEDKIAQIEEKMEKMEAIIDNIEKDIYAEEGFDFEIVCPYCNNEFIIDSNSEKSEIECPECKNIIELDWTGETDDCQEGCDSGNCSHCAGCDVEGYDDEDSEDDDEDM